MVERSSQYIKNKSSHCAFQPILIGIDDHRKGIIRHVRNWSQTISSNFSCLFRLKIAIIAKDKCSHCAMDLDYCFRWLSPAPSHRIIALWVHPFIPLYTDTLFEEHNGSQRIYMQWQSVGSHRPKRREYPCNIMKRRQVM